MMHSDQSLYRELTNLAREIDGQIRYVKEFAETNNVDPVKMQDKNGGFVLAPLFAAKADCLNAMATLKANKTMIIHNPPKRR